MNRWTPTRLQPAIEWLLLVVCSLTLCLHTMPRAWRTLNTDFPNYYLTAKLVHQGYDMSQAYDWRWLQREKDHRAIDQRIIGLAPITPFSTLFVWPLIDFSPLIAKRIWICLQVALLAPVALMLRSSTGQPLRRIALIAAVSFPLHRNLLYGQFYILLLAMLVAAHLAYCKRLFAVSGSLIAIAAMTKIFPAVFLIYFLRKRCWRALTAAGVTVSACAALSIAVFGWCIHRHYLQAVLPWTLRGDTLPPYLLASSSMSTLLHRLFIYEPQWNPHPWHNLPWLAATLAPVLQTLLVAPAILLIRPSIGRIESTSAGAPGWKADDDRRTTIEWSALLSATLAISTIPASYNFTLLVLPMVGLCAFLLPRRPIAIAIALIVYLGIGYPAWTTTDANGLRAFLHVPRLFLVVAFTLLCCCALASVSTRLRPLWKEELWWGVGLVVFAVVGIVGGLRHQRTVAVDYPYRLPISQDLLLSADPAQNAYGVESISLRPSGYVVTTSPTDKASYSLSGNLSEEVRGDELSFATSPVGDWIEEVTASSSIVPPAAMLAVGLTDGHAPQLSSDGLLLASIRSQRGRGQLVLKDGSIVTPISMNVLEAVSLGGDSFLVAATEGQELPAIFRVDRRVPPQPTGLGAARYPAVSPDGRWLAFSKYQSGAWNLWLLDRSTSAIRRLTNADCNQVQPAWEADSKTLLYASDCGRALGFTAVCRRRVIP